MLFFDEMFSLVNWPNYLRQRILSQLDAMNRTTNADRSNTLKVLPHALFMQSKTTFRVF